MQPDEIIALMTVVLVLAYAMSQAYTWLRTNDLSWLLVGRFTPPPQTPPVTPRSTKAPKPRSYTRRSLEDRLNEQKLITAALGVGLDPAWLAKTLRGHPAWNRRRINSVARQIAE